MIIYGIQCTFHYIRFFFVLQENSTVPKSGTKGEPIILSSDASENNNDNNDNLNTFRTLNNTNNQINYAKYVIWYKSFASNHDNICHVKFFCFFFF